MEVKNNNISELGEYDYNCDKSKKYIYINVKNLDSNNKEKIIEILEKNNFIQNNFLRFVYTVYLDYYKTIIKTDQCFDEKNKGDTYSVNLNILDDYNKNKFAIIIKQDKEDIKNQQIIFYYSQTQELYNQFLLSKYLKNKNYYEIPELSLINSKNQKDSNKEYKSINSNNSKNNKKDKINNINNKFKVNNNNSINIKYNNINIQDKTKNSNNVNKKLIQSNNNINNNIYNPDINNNNKNNIKIEEINKNKEKYIYNYFRYNDLENDVINYLKKKILNGKNNKELPNIFYSIRNLDDKYDKVDNIKSIFYDEFDSVFMVKNDINFDDNKVKINFKYENKIFENNKAKNTNNLIIKGKNLVFVECKYEANYNKAFEDGKLFKKIYKFRDLIDKTFGTKGYGVIILYLYNTKFIYEAKDFNNFKNAISTGHSKCPKEKDDVLMYNVFSFYINASVYMFNYSNVYNEIKDVKEKQQKTQKELDNLKAELNELKVILNNMKKEK